MLNIGRLKRSGASGLDCFYQCVPLCLLYVCRSWLGEPYSQPKHGHFPRRWISHHLFGWIHLCVSEEWTDFLLIPTTGLTQPYHSFSCSSSSVAVDLEKHTMTILSPAPRPLPRKYLLCTDLKFVDLRWPLIYEISFASQFHCVLWTILSQVVYIIVPALGFQAHLQLHSSSLLRAEFFRAILKIGERKRS